MEEKKRHVALRISIEKKLRGQMVIKKLLEEGQCPDCLLLSIEIDELKEALVNSNSLQKLIESLEMRYSSQFLRTNINR